MPNMLEGIIRFFCNDTTIVFLLTCHWESMNNMIHTLAESQRDIAHRARHHKPHTLLHRDTREIAQQPKKGREVKPHTVPQLCAQALRQRPQSRTRQPAKAQRARAPAQLMDHACAQRERGAAVCKDQPFGRILRCRAQPSAVYAIGGHQSTLAAAGGRRTQRDLWPPVL